MARRRFDWPACFRAFSNRPAKSPHRNQTFAGGAPSGRLKLCLSWAVVQTADAEMKSVKFGREMSLGVNQ
jgi:hypothetical protein